MIRIFGQISVWNIDEFMKILLVFLNCEIIKGLFPKTLHVLVVLTTSWKKVFLKPHGKSELDKAY